MSRSSPVYAWCGTPQAEPDCPEFHTQQPRNTATAGPAQLTATPFVPTATPPVAVATASATVPPTVAPTVAPTTVPTTAPATTTPSLPLVPQPVREIIM